MTTGGTDLLHDPAGLLAADTARLLPAAATAGAQVRAVQSVIAELPPMDPPRALVVVGAHAPAEVALLLAVVGTGAGAPIVAVQEIPAWVGALDIVLVLADQVHDPAAASAAEMAVRRGATVIVRAAAGTPSPGTGTVLFAPQVAVSEALAAPGRLALLLGVAHRAGLLRTPPDLAGWADTMDATALACHPSAEEFVNPAVALAEYLGGGAPLLIGAEPVGDAVAALAVRALADLAGIGGAVLPSRVAATSPAVLRRAATTRDLFADPFADPVDGPPPSAPVIITLHPDSVAAGALAAALPRAPVVAPDRNSSSDRRPEHDWRPGQNDGRAPDRAEGPPDTAGAAADLVLRMTFAAVYLGLAAGQIPPLDAPDGLGREGTSLGAVRTEERGAFAPIRDLDLGADGDDDRLDDDFVRSIGGQGSVAERIDPNNDDESDSTART